MHYIVWTQHDLTYHVQSICTCEQKLTRKKNKNKNSEFSMTMTNINNNTIQYS